MSKTIVKLKYDYFRYISRLFAKRQIKTITEIDLKEYTQTLTRDTKLKKKAYFAYKGVLNLIFGYAIYHKIIETNPVLSIKNTIYLKNCDTRKPRNVEKILSCEEIDAIKNECDRRITQRRYEGYCVYAYVTKLAIETGMRAGELCALREEDVYSDYIHIHAQQLYVRRDGGKEYYYTDHTKDEKGISNGGRRFPITPPIRAIFDANRNAKEYLGLDTEYVFCNLEGEWIKTDAYETFLRRMMQSLNMPVTNNHAFRMSLNSNVFIPLGINVADRAILLGHSIETNLKHFSYARKDNLDELTRILSKEPSKVVTPGHPAVIRDFPKRKSPKSIEFKASS